MSTEVADSSLTIGLFQLESLLIAGSPFVFLDLRESAVATTSQRINLCLQRAHATTLDEAKTKLHQLTQDMSFPVVVICETGSRSRAAAANLAAAGYDNVFVVAGGVSGLLSEI